MSTIVKSNGCPGEACFSGPSRRGEFHVAGQPSLIITNSRDEMEMAWSGAVMLMTPGIVRV